MYYLLTFPGYSSAVEGSLKLHTQFTLSKQ